MVTLCIAWASSKISTRGEFSMTANSSSTLLINLYCVR
ncbi:hypothetical protein BMETH_2863_0 [methanotrophic bacterial endosymbiont of Bathymodiolus sp.]|nr:hypothetical protein BMETH_2863_0 [methanotrophic bacterial endosymbiont of Bathymodiolus sp.]